MRKAFRSMVLGAAAFVAGTLAASAAIIDFTDNSIYSSRSATSAMGSVGGIGFTITGSSPHLTFAANGPGPIGGLAGENDGVGLGDDEIGGTEYITVVFDRAVTISTVLLLDFFSSRTGDHEHALLYGGASPMTSNFITEFEAVQPFGGGLPGFGSFAVSTTGTTFSLDAGLGNDGIGVGDFSLAGFEINPIAVPLPAAAVLLGTALFGFCRVSRRSA